MSIISNILNHFHLNKDTYSVRKQLGSYSANVYKLTHETGEIRFLKIHKSSTKLHRELFALEILKDEPFVPKVICYSEEIEPAILLSYLPGEPFDLDNPDNLFESGRALAQIHAYKLATFDPIESELNDESWYKSLFKNFERNLGVCSQEDLFNLDKVYKWFHQKMQHLDEVTKPSLTHFDYRPGNLLKIKNEHIGVLDFESARGGAPHIDFIKMYIASNSINPKLFEQFVNGYNSISPIPEDLYESLCFYIVYMSVACVSWSIKDDSPTSNFCNSHVSLINKYLEAG